MTDTRGIKRAAIGMAGGAVMALSLLTTSGGADAASLDTRGGSAVTQGTLTKPLPTVLIKSVVQPVGVSWED